MSTAKTYRILRDKSLWRIEWEGGGQMTSELKGLYTSEKHAKQAIERYEASKVTARKAKRGVKNVESESTA